MMRSRLSMPIGFLLLVLGLGLLLPTPERWAPTACPGVFRYRLPVPPQRPTHPSAGRSVATHLYPAPKLPT
jgi:hypothetical protein